MPLNNAHRTVYDEVDDSVVVTGMGVVSAAGVGVGALTDVLESGRVCITGAVDDGLGVAGRLRGFNFEENLTDLTLPETVRVRAARAGRRAPLSACASLVVALEAWRDAFSDEAMYAPSRVNLIVAGSNLNQGYQQRVAAKHQIDPEYVPASYALHYLDSDQLGILSEVLGIRGEGVTVGGASASGLMGIIHAYRQIRSGLCDACVVVGAMADLSPVELTAFRHTGALGGKCFADEPERACRPFDEAREGFIYGQGSACLILEAGSRARRRGARIWGEIAGGAICMDGNRSSNPSVEGEARAMTAAMEQSGESPGALEYLNAHATSSVMGDEVELQAIERAFGSHVGHVSVNATKGLIGHCLHAAGVVATVATLIQMSRGFLHQNVNLDRPIESSCRLIRLTPEPRRISLALVNAFGFGGLNSSLVIKRGF